MNFGGCVKHGIPDCDECFVDACTSGFAVRQLRAAVITLEEDQAKRMKGAWALQDRVTLLEQRVRFLLTTPQEDWNPDEIFNWLEDCTG